MFQQLDGRTEVPLAGMRGWKGRERVGNGAGVNMDTGLRARLPGLQTDMTFRRESS